MNSNKILKTENKTKKLIVNEIENRMGKIEITYDRHSTKRS